ncbi:CRIB domain-containing protein RIC7 [Gossypium raimondii]|nr:CRIB domain-containing protein RIC7 [Gossypium raimondii]
MKGLLKGFRYITQLFENGVNFNFAESDKEPEMQIGMPTDVKHVAHIGWDGPSAVNSTPSWVMNEFKTPAGGLQSTPLAQAGEERLSRKGLRAQSSSTRDMPDLPKSSKRTSSTKENASSTKQSKKPSKSTRKPKDASQTTETTTKDSKKSRRKKVKDMGGEGSSRRSRTTQESDTLSEAGSLISCDSEFVEGEGN